MATVHRHIFRVARWEWKGIGRNGLPYRSILTLALRPRLYKWAHTPGEWSLTLLGVRLHYARWECEGMNPEGSGKNIRSTLAAKKQGEDSP